MSPQKHIHIISFDVPYPANYGGVIDVYYKIRALHSAGIRIHLHCFEYGRAEALHLESLCEKVYYYKREMSKTHLFNTLPFVVVTRVSEKLITNLLRDDHPVLFEGLHSCFHLPDPRLANRIRIVRTHNIEHDYYRSLQKVERSVFKKLYFGIEAKKLERFERVLADANHVAAISAADALALGERYKNVQHIAAFHPNEEVTIREGKGKYCLYHGNLEVGENNEAAMFLIQEVFSKISVPLIIAGRKPSRQLIEAARSRRNVKLMANINTMEIDELIKDAQINILPTFQSTGIKLKLLAALFNGRHCIVNTPMVANTGLDVLCSVADTAGEMIYAIKENFGMPFDMTEKERRESILSEEFSNGKNAAKLIGLF